MEKLLKLLNEFQEEKNSEIRFLEIVDNDFFVSNYQAINEGGLGYETIISKKFGFIKRLVENDKIDFKEMYEKIGKPQIVMYDERYKEEELCEGKQISERDYYEDVLMLLSIQDEPIEFLASILLQKNEQTNEPPHTIGGLSKEERRV